MEQAGFCLQWWNADWSKGEIITLFNRNLTNWHYAYLWSTQVITGDGHFGDWTVFSKKATPDDVADPKAACTRIMDYARLNADNPNFRDYSGLQVVFEHKLMTSVYQTGKSISVSFTRPLKGSYFGDPAINQNLVEGQLYHVLLNAKHYNPTHRKNNWGASSDVQALEFVIARLRASRLGLQLVLLGLCSIFYI